MRAHLETFGPGRVMVWAGPGRSGTHGSTASAIRSLKTPFYRFDYTNLSFELSWYTLPMTAGTSAAPHAVAVNERIHTEGAPLGHSHYSSQLFTPSPPSDTVVDSESGSVENTLPACRNPLETS